MMAEEGRPDSTQATDGGNGRGEGRVGDRLSERRTGQWAVAAGSEEGGKRPVAGIAHPQIQRLPLESFAG